jgi:hypothetical protein
LRAFSLTATSPRSAYDTAWTTANTNIAALCAGHGGRAATLRFPYEIGRYLSPSERSKRNRNSSYYKIGEKIMAELVEAAKR